MLRCVGSAQPLELSDSGNFWVAGHGLLGPKLPGLQSFVLYFLEFMAWGLRSSLFYSLEFKPVCLGFASSRFRFKVLRASDLAETYPTPRDGTCNTIEAVNPTP